MAVPGKTDKPWPLACAGGFSPLLRMTMEDKAIIALRGDCFCAPLFPDWLSRDSRGAVRYEEQANLPNADVGFRLVLPQ